MSQCRHKSSFNHLFLISSGIRLKFIIGHILKTPVGRPLSLGDTITGTYSSIH
jgi:hypothetical protein